jgi:hypothetical protein
VGLFDFLKPRDDGRRRLLDLIIHNTDTIEKTEHKRREDAEYLAICLIIDDLSKREKGRAGYQTMMNILQTDYPQHLSDVITYVGWSIGKLHLKPEAEAALMARHSK